MPGLYDINDPSASVIAGSGAAGRSMANVKPNVHTETYGQSHGVDIGDIAALGAVTIGAVREYKVKAEDDAYNMYVSNMEQDPEYRPDFKAKDFKAKAWNRALVDKTDRALKEESVKQQRYKTNKDRIDKQITDAKYFGQGAKAAARNGEYNTAFDQLEKGYESFYDNQDLSIDRENKQLNIRDKRNGQLTSIPFKSDEDMYNYMEKQIDMLLFDPKDPTHSKAAKYLLMNQQERDEFNIGNLSNGYLVEDKKGNRAMRYDGMRDPITGDLRGPLYVLDGETEQISEEQLKALGFKNMVPIEKSMATKKTESEINENISQKEANEAEKEKKGKEKLSPETRLAQELSAITGVDIDIAMDHVAKRSLDKGKLDAAVASIKENAGLGSSETKKLLTDMGLLDDFQGTGKGVTEELRTKQGERNAAKAQAENKAKGVREPKQGEQKGSPKLDTVIAALEKQFPKAKDGTKKYLGKNKFVRKNGKWVSE